MSAETPVIRNFLGLEGYERIASRFQLILNAGYGNTSVLQVGDVAPIPPGDIRDLGLSLRVNADLSALLEATGTASLTAEDVSLYVISESGFLKNRDTLVERPLLQLEDTVQVAQWRAPRPDSLLDRRHGFDVYVIIAMNKQVKHVPLRPRRMGTILAEVYFGIRPTKLGDGFVPLPLTDEIRQDRLPKGTVLWIEPLGELFEAESLDQALAIYIDEELHSDIGTLRTKESKLLQTQFALEALGQIVYLASAELANREITVADEQSVFGQYLFSQLQRIIGTSIKEPRDALLRVKSDPSTVAAQVTAQARYQSRLRSMVRGEGSGQ